MGIFTMNFLVFVKSKFTHHSKLSIFLHFKATENRQSESREHIYITVTVGFL